jgi:S1-C subfamily serine protease/Tfp pilus assembly protein PilF
MRPARVLLASFFVLLVASWAPTQTRDLREQFGTPNLEAAKQIAQAIRLSQAKKHKESLSAIQAAVKADPQCQMAHYWRGIILGNLGDIDESIVAYKKALSDDVRRGRPVSAHTATNLALTYARLDKFDESNLWFSRAILEDSANAAGQRGKAYRNMAITLSRQGKHLAAAAALALAYQDKAPNITPAMLRAFFQKVEDEEAATLLFFGERLPRLPKRGRDTSLTALALAGGPAEAIAELLPDPKGRFVVAVPPNAGHYYLVATAGKAAVTKVATPEKIVSACLAGDHLYALTAAPAKVLQLEAATGKEVKATALKGPPARASSLAVLPAQGLALFCASDLVYGARLDTGGVFKSDIPGQQVVVHPNQRDVYSSVKPERGGGGGGGFVIVDGRPYYFRRNFDWLQTTLFHSVLTPTGLLLAGVRENAASNARRLSLSPDGGWVAIAGGGGYRPRKPAGGAAGYGVAVFAAHNLEHLQGFFKTDAYPLGVAFNPVTGQVVGVRGADAKVYHLGDSGKVAADIKGKFSGPAAWSGNGRFLVLANDPGGLSVYENALGRDELARAADWWKAIKVVRLMPAGPAVAPSSFEAVAALAKFAATAPARKDLGALFVKAATSGRTSQPGRWHLYPPYVKDEAHRQAAVAAAQQLALKGDAGIAIFRVRAALKAHPDSVPLKFYLAEALRGGDQPEEAEKLYTAVVQGDTGRTELSLLALNELAGLLSARGEELAALHCLAHSLFLDRASPKTLALALPLLKKHKFEAEAARLAKLGAELPGSLTEELPKLPKPAAPGKALRAAALYKQSVSSVVLIQADGGTGSGVCVARPDIVLTNDHVINRGAGDIFVTPFAYKDKELTRLPRVRARVLFRSAAEDVAVLKLEKAPPSLKPLPVAAADLDAGEKVYAIGSPGLGKDVLEQSISEGLVSSPRRKVAGSTYLQHTAAVNPGNSGGPLLDEHGRVVGLVTLKARLEGVSFAVRVETLRKIFNSP